jgi:hypothetical protein
MKLHLVPLYQTSEWRSVALRLRGEVSAGSRARPATGKVLMPASGQDGHASNWFSCCAQVPQGCEGQYSFRRSFGIARWVAGALQGLPIYLDHGPHRGASSRRDKKLCAWSSFFILSHCPCCVSLMPPYIFQ